MDRNAKIDELLAKEEIREAIYRCARGTDRQDAAMIRSCYHPDGIDDHGLYKQKGHDFAGLVERSTLGGAHHIIGQIIFVEFKGNVAYTESTVEYHNVAEATESMDIRDDFIGARYLDRFEKRGDGPWLIAYRRVVWDWRYYLPASAKKRNMPATCVWYAKGSKDESYHIGEFPKTV